MSSCVDCGRELMSAFRGTKKSAERCRSCWEKSWRQKQKEAKA